MSSKLTLQDRDSVVDVRLKCKLHLRNSSTFMHIWKEDQQIKGAKLKNQGLDTVETGAINGFISPQRR